MRDLKVMVLQDMHQLDIFRRPIYSDNKYKISGASYVNKIVIVREDTQISLVYEGEGEVVKEIKEKEMTGLVAKDTGAPKFVEI